MKDFRTKDSYGYALGVFMASEISKIEPRFFITNPEVKTIHAKILHKHKQIKRKGVTQSYADGIKLGSIAYDMVCEQMDGTPIAINACIRLIHMKNSKVIERVFDIDGRYFEIMKQRGVQDRTMQSVKVANKFLELLDEMFTKLEQIKKEQKK